MAETATLITAEEFLADPCYDGWELIDGVPKEVTMGARANATTFLVGGHMVPAVARDGGVALSSEQRYRLWPDRPHLVRKADASYYRSGREPSLDLGEIDTAPDLVVEVVSTHEGAEDAETKRVQYLTAGVKLLWVFYPLTRTVHIFGADGLVDIFSEGDILTGRDILPSFSVPVAHLFPAG